MTNDSEIDNETKNLNREQHGDGLPVCQNPPPVPLWQTWGLRIFFAGLVFVIGKWQLMSILQGPFEWTAWRGVGHSLLFTLALFLKRTN